MNYNPKTHALIIILLALSFALIMPESGYAQDNLLQNGGFNGAGRYVDQRPGGSEYPFALAPGWGGWQTNSPRSQPWMNIEPIAFPHTGDLKQEGDASQNIGRGSGTFTASVSQVVNNIPEGTTLRFSVWVFQENDSGSGARTRVGIGVNSGNNPLAGEITWSDWLNAVRSWQEVSVEATVPAGSVSVFIYSTQNGPNDPNQVYFDDAKLVVVGEGEPNVGSGDPNVPPPPTSTPRPAFAAFATPQEADETGRVEHRVRTGDTLAAISVAYGVPVSEILSLNGLERGSFLQVGQTLLIKRGGDIPVAETTEESTVDSTAESTAEVAAAQATSESTQPPTEESATHTPTTPPEPTEVPPTPTEAPPAPVEEGASADPLAIEAAICISLYNDLNQNGIQDAGDPLLAGGTITLVDEAGGESQVVTDDSEPPCFSELEPDDYTVNAEPPAGFGLRRNSLLVSVPPGQQFQVRFDAIEGLEIAPTPTAATARTTDMDSTPVEEADPIRNLRNIAGIIVLGLAGVILVGGIGVAVLLGRR